MAKEENFLSRLLLIKISDVADAAFTYMTATLRTLALRL
jgi:hypothetical protein